MANTAPLEFNQISNEGKLKLVDLAFMPFVIGISCMPVCALALAIWAYELGGDFSGLLGWGGLYIVAMIGIRRLLERYGRERRQAQPDGRLVLKWVPIICGVALAHAFGLTLPLFLIDSHLPFEFMLMYYVIVAATMAAFATHLTPLLRALQWLFYPCWGALILLSPWTFPEHWHFMWLLLLVFAISIHKHSLIGEQFFLRQIQLEENGARLAESFRLAKSQAEAALQARNRFLTTASHDLRQPVQAMGFLIESVLQRNRQADLVPSLADLKQSVRSVTQMFNSLLDLSRIESGSIKPDPENISLHWLVQDIATVFKEEARARQLDLRLGRAFARAVVTADALLLRQAIVNLVQNALRYTLKGGVLIGVRRRGEDWQIEIWDTGIGVALAARDKIHSPFYRHEHAWHLDNAGHGVGLAVVSSCVELMGATHGFTSREGRGSKFWLRLPAASSQPLPDRQQRLRQENVAPLARLSGDCLIIDDDPHICTAWEALLRAWGIQVKCVASAAEAFALLDSAFQPTAILCDQRLRSGESGFDLLQALLERRPDAHGAMVSGEHNSPELMRAEAEGYLVLCKPLEPEVLHAVLSQWLQTAEPIPSGAVPPA